MSRDQTMCPSSFHIDTDSVGYALRLNPIQKQVVYFDITTCKNLEPFFISKMETMDWP